MASQRTEGKRRERKKQKGIAKEKYEKYWDILAYNRNIHMKDTLADSIHNNKHDFIGVGCKHLYGKKGIIQLLKDDGYLVECMK